MKEVRSSNVQHGMYNARPILQTLLVEGGMGGTLRKNGLRFEVRGSVSLSWERRKRRSGRWMDGLDGWDGAMCSAAQRSAVTAGSNESGACG